MLRILIAIFVLSGSCSAIAEGNSFWDPIAENVMQAPGCPGESASKDKPFSVPSPNGRFSAAVEGGVGLRVYTDRRLLNPIIAIECLAELRWNSDSTAIVITSSDGGAVGTWSTSLILVGTSNVSQTDIGAKVTQEFSHRKGGCSEIPNVASLGWMSPERILLIAEAPPHSSCSDMGVTSGYEIDRDGEIHRRYEGWSLEKLQLHMRSAAREPANQSLQSKSSSSLRSSAAAAELHR